MENKLRPALIAVYFCLLAGCGTAQDQELLGFDSTGKGESVIGAQALWPNGDVYLLDDFELLRVWTIGVAWQLEMSQLELEENTPVRLHFIKEPKKDGLYREFELTWEGGGEAHMGTYEAASSAKAGYPARAGYGSVRHELGHIIGLSHTHQRIDRDDNIVLHTPYLDMEDDRIEHNLISQRAHQCHVGPYDPRSIMHYSSGGFAEGMFCAATSRRPPDGSADPEECVVFFDEQWISRRDHFSSWNYSVISILYCDERYCGDNCAPRERCGRAEDGSWLPQDQLTDSAMQVVANLKRVYAWERSDEGQAWADRYPEATCGPPPEQPEPPTLPLKTSSVPLTNMFVGCSRAITHTGCCTDAALYKCHNGTLHQKHCATTGATCGWVDQLGAYDCGGTGEDPTGENPKSCN